jgi:hypothetical protein
MQQTIKMSQEIRNLVKALFWVLEKRPEEISTSATTNSYIVFNLDKDKRLGIEVEV